MHFRVSYRPETALLTLEGGFHVLRNDTLVAGRPREYVVRRIAVTSADTISPR